LALLRSAGEWLIPLINRDLRRLLEDDLPAQSGVAVRADLGRRLVLGRTLAARGNLEAAEVEIAEAVGAFRVGLPAGHPSLGEARTILLQALGPGDWRVEKVESLLGSCRAEAANGNRDEQAPR